MSSIGIATLGLFDQGIGGIGGGGAIMKVTEEKPRPKVRLISVTTAEHVSKKTIEIKSIKSGD